MMVQLRRWSDATRYGRWVFGKVHWMAAPWETLCGQTVEDSWIPIRRSSLHRDESQCRKCFGAVGVRE